MQACLAEMETLRQDKPVTHGVVYVQICTLKKESTFDSHLHLLEKAHAELHEMVGEARICLKTLQEIALKPNPLTQVEYI